ncbi:MAG TPA: hypothetical protein PLD55_09825 [bacterium]|jgi:hypothetical protein|nr:hypothetical protein [bacterium]
MRFSKKQRARIDLVNEHLKKGVLITHTCDGGMLAEHYYEGTDKSGNIVGIPTPETKRFMGIFLSNISIHPLNITHINRQSVESIPYLASGL